MGFKQNVSGLLQCIFVVAYRFRDRRGWEKVPTPQISIIYIKSDCKFLLLLFSCCCFVLAKFFKEFNSGPVLFFKLMPNFAILLGNYHFQ